MRLLAACVLVLGLAIALIAATRVSAAPGAHASIGFQPTALGIATDAAGNVYLSNPQQSQKVQEYSSDGKLLAERGNFAISEIPRTIAVGATGDLYVADGASKKVVVFGPDGNLVREWAVPQWSGAGRGIAVDGAGNVFVPEIGTILRFGPDGGPLPSWGTAGTGSGKLTDVYGLAAAPSGSLYVADTYGNRIDAFDASGTLVNQWGGNGRQPGQVDWPYGIAVAPSGDVYIADTANARVQEFTAAGAFVRSWGQGGGGPGHFDTATGIAVDPAGYVYVADAGAEYPDLGTARVQKFTAEGQFISQWGEVQKPRPKRPRLVARVLGKTKDAAVFRFSSPQKGARFQCTLGGAGVPDRLRKWWRGCSSPQRFAHLSPGRKLFQVRVVVGEDSGPPARHAWTVARRRR